LDLELHSEKQSQEDIRNAAGEISQVGWQRDHTCNKTVRGQIGVAALVKYIEKYRGHCNSTRGEDGR